MHTNAAETTTPDSWALARAKAVMPAPSAELQSVVDRAAAEALSVFAAKGLQSNQLGITVVDLRDPAHPVQGSFRGGEQFYPASVIKLFYLAATQQWLEEGRLQDSAELRRALRDMIVDSYNEATGYVVDCLTGTTSGPELPPDELEKWYEKRNVVNRYFTALGYTGINANRKPWCEGPYGREMQSVQLHKPNHRNWLTTDATARLLADIATGRAVSPQRSEEMLELLRREPFVGGDSNDQARGYTGQALPAGSKLWSKAGWTSQARHDAALVELPGGRRLVFVVFTLDHASERGIIPAVVRTVLKDLGVTKP